MSETLRDRQRRQTHEAIREAALVLATERGVASITVADIAAAAGVSQRTFFNHFRTKEEALLPPLPEFRPAAVETFVAGEEPDLLAALQTLVVGHVADLHRRTGAVRPAPERILNLVQANPGLLPLMLKAFDALESQVAALVARRTGRDETDMFCRLAALVSTGVVRAALMRPPPSAPVGPSSGEGSLPAIDADLDAVASAFAALRELLLPAPGR